jgi:hypothetical protein
MRPNTFQEWLTDTLDEDQIKDLAEHGADAGWPGLTYTSDCVKLHDEFEEEIWNRLANDAAEFGHESVAEFVGTFNRKDMASDPDQFKNLLVWYMAETIAHEIVDSTP